jgi:preprotein translocase subunit SecF
MEFFKKTNIDFLGIKKFTSALSIIICVLCLICIAVKGINFDLDFTGGYSFQVNYPESVDTTAVHKTLDNAGFGHSEVIHFGSDKTIMIRMMPKQYMQTHVVSDSEQTTQSLLKQHVQKALGKAANIKSISYIGPEVGKELTQKGILAIFIAVLATMIYIALRFDLKFAISSAVALAHDPIIILGIFSLFQFSFDLTALAAILAIIGYSLNDTVVVYDRVRENFRSMRTASVGEVINSAINDTLSRTVITSGLTLVVVIILFIFGGPSIHYFSLALIIGVIVGTYSSIYVAGTLAVALGLTRESLLPPARAQDNTP